MAHTLVKGKLRQIVNKAYKSSDYVCSYYGKTELPVRVTNVRMYVDNTLPQQWVGRYQFEIDLEVTIPTYDGGPVQFRFGADRNLIKGIIRRRLSYQTISFRDKCLMFTSGGDGNTEVVIKKISIIRNDTPPSLNN